MSAPAATLPGKLAEAERAEGPHRERVSHLEAAMREALEREDFAKAALLKDDLMEAREQLALAEATTGALRDRTGAVERARQDAERAIREAEARSRAERTIAAAMETESRAQAQISEALDAMWAALGEAQDAWRRAVAAQGGIAEARQAEVQARAVLNPPPRGHGLPVVVGESRASSLTNTSSLVRELAGWRR